MIKELLKEKLSNAQRLKLRSHVNRVRAFGSGRNLERLAEIYRTDKTGAHFYTPHYQRHLGKFRLKKINLLEIGVGGYEDPYDGGNSLRMWKRYFPFGRIYSIDIFDKSPLQERRIKIFKGSQVDEEVLSSAVREIGEIDIIIDDGSHVNEHVIKTFEFLFPKLKDGGIYVVEDTQTSYWEDFGGNSEDRRNSDTIMNYFKGLTDSMNNKEFVSPGYKQTYFDKKIVSMHFYHNLIFIFKGDNDEASTRIVNNSPSPLPK